MRYGENWAGAIIKEDGMKPNDGIKPIVIVSNMDADYYTCNACNRKDDLKNISVGYSMGEYSTTHSIRLCRICRQILKEQL